MEGRDVLGAHDVVGRRNDVVRGNDSRVVAERAEGADLGHSCDSFALCGDHS